MSSLQIELRTCRTGVRSTFGSRRRGSRSRTKHTDLILPTIYPQGRISANLQAHLSRRESLNGENLPLWKEKERGITARGTHPADLTHQRSIHESLKRITRRGCGAPRETHCTCGSVQPANEEPSNPHDERRGRTRRRRGRTHLDRYL